MAGSSVSQGSLSARSTCKWTAGIHGCWWSQETADDTHACLSHKYTKEHKPVNGHDSILATIRNRVCCLVTRLGVSTGRRANSQARRPTNGDTTPGDPSATLPLRGMRGEMRDRKWAHLPSGPIDRPRPTHNRGHVGRRRSLALPTSEENPPRPIGSLVPTLNPGPVKLPYTGPTDQAGAATDGRKKRY